MDLGRGYEMVEEAIIAVMGMILSVRMVDGRTRCVQFLRDNDLDDRDRQHPLLLLLSSLSSSS